MQLLDHCLTFPNLIQAWERVRRNRGCAGTDGMSLQRFETGLHDNLERLRSQVLNGDYTPAPLLGVRIAKDNGDTRQLAVPAVGDRVLQTSVTRVLTPLLEPLLEDCSFGYREGRSVQQAIARVARYRAAGYGWVVDADITACFDNIPHDAFTTNLSLEGCSAKLPARGNEIRSL